MDLQTYRNKMSGLQLNLGNLGAVDLNLAASDKTRSAVGGLFHNIQETTGLDLMSLLPTRTQTARAAAPTIMGLDPKMVYIAGGALAFILIIAALRK